MGIIFDRGMAFLESNIEETKELCGQASTEYIRGSISESYPPASTPLTPPHMRTMALRDGVYYKTDEKPDAVTIISQRGASVSFEGGKISGVQLEMVPEWLEFGTKKMTARPYMTPAMLATLKICAAAIKAGMSAVNTKSGGGVYPYSPSYTKGYTGI